MQKQEPNMGEHDHIAPSWTRRKQQQPLTYWTIASAVCTGILIASAIEKLTDALLIWATLYVTLDPAITRWLHGH